MNRRSEKAVLNEEIKVRLEKIFMCEISQRYAFLYSLDLPHYAISHINLNSTPNIAVSNFLNFVASYPDFLGTDDKTFYSKLTNAVLMFKLPKGIPEK